MSENKTSEDRLKSAREYKLKNAEKIKAYNKKRNDAVRADPVKWAAKLEANRRSTQRNMEKRKRQGGRTYPLDALT